MKGNEKEDGLYGTRGNFVELDPGSSSRPLPEVRIDGPYGAPAEDVFDNEVAVLIGAGIGEFLISMTMSTALGGVNHSSVYEWRIIPVRNLSWL